MWAIRTAPGGSLELDPSFDEFVLRGSARLLRSAYLLTGDRGHAEDLLQVALVRTARHWDRARDAPAAYAYRVLINLMHDRRRHLSRRVAELPLDDRDAFGRPVVDHAEPLLDHDAIIRAVKLLAPRQREVVVLRFFADLSVSETAQAIGSSTGSVKTHTSRALARLRELLADDPEIVNHQMTEVTGAD
jgi:RNA polymerase sigma-70 factor (sigma-E family)